MARHNGNKKCVGVMVMPFFAARAERRPVASKPPNAGRAWERWSRVSARLRVAAPGRDARNRLAGLFDAYGV